VKELEHASLRFRIRSAFAGGVQPERECIAPHECEECAELRQAFHGIAWDAMPDALIESHDGSLVLLSPEAFVYYLPGYMLYALEHMTWHDSPSEHTVYAIGPNASDDDEMLDCQRERLKPLTAEQGALLDEFLALVERDGDLGTHIGDLHERRETLRYLWQA
jgi:hypothetical protein